jgi:hypothetical protein
VAVAVARAAGHAVATAHCADHSLGVLIYGAKAAEAAGNASHDEQVRQLSKLPNRLRTLITSAMQQRRTSRCSRRRRRQTASKSRVQRPRRC